MPEPPRAASAVGAASGYCRSMPAASRRRGTFDEMNDACFIVRDKNGQALGYSYFEDDRGATGYC